MSLSYLTHVAAEQYTEYPKPNNWCVTLFSSDGTTWTVSRGLSQADAKETALTFGRFAGIKARAGGKVIFDPRRSKE